MKSVKKSTVVTAFMLLICSLFTAGCDSTDPPAQLAITAQPKSTLDPASTSLLVTLLHQYFSLKDALVATRNMQADSAAKTMQQSLITLKSSLPADSSTNVTCDTTLRNDILVMEQSLQKILAVKDEGCEVKRVNFQPLSDALYHLLQQVKLKNVVVYHSLCPMALNEEGARWLSQYHEIKNPYFGQKMLTCGVVTDTLF